MPTRQWLMKVLTAISITLFLTMPLYAEVYCDKESKLFHAAGCQEINKIEKRNLLTFKTEPQAEARGYYPCQICLPPVAKDIEKAATRRFHSVPIKKVEKYIGDKENKICHHAWCMEVKAIDEKSKVEFKDIEDAWKKDYQPCKKCYPPMKPKKNNVTIDEKSEETKNSEFIEPILE